MSARTSQVMSTRIGCVLWTFLFSLSATKLPAQSNEPESPPTRPRVLVWVEGAPEDDVIWRGWPVLIRVQTLEGEAPTRVELNGPTSVLPATGIGARVLSAAVSAKLELGTYTLVVGSERVEVTVVDPPTELDALQRAAQARLRVRTALVVSDTAAAREAAEAWVKAEPSSFEAREAQGDVLRAAGEIAAALAAYDEALRRMPRGVEPPPANLHLKIAALLRLQVTRMPTSRPIEPSVDESRYYERIDAGDAAFAAGDRTAAARCYAEAEAIHREKKLALPTFEVEERRARLGSVGSAPVVPLEHVFPGKVVPAAELAEAAILGDTAGQWAHGASAGSEYGTPAYGAVQMIGAPDVASGNDSPNAWCHASTAKGMEWVELSFAKPVRATGVRVRQTYNPGAIVKVEAIDTDGKVHLWWQGIDPARPAGALNAIAWFNLRLERTDYLVQRIKLTLDLDAVLSWQEIDAVQLVSAPL